MLEECGYMLDECGYMLVEQGYILARLHTTLLQKQGNMLK